MLSIGTLGRDTVLYGLATLLRYSTNLILLPVYTAVLTTSEYGALETIVVTVQTLMIFVNIGLSNAVLRYFSECEDQASVDMMIRTATLAVFVFSSLLFITSIPFFDGISGALLKDSERSSLISLAFIWSIGGALNEQLFAYLRAQRSPGKFVFVSGVQFVLLTTLILLLMTRYSFGIEGVLIGNIVVVWLTSLGLLPFWFRSRSLSFSWLKILLAFGLPLILSRLSWLILNSADRYFLAYFRELSEVGLYSLGYKVGLMVQIGAIVPFQLAWAPFVFERYAQAGDTAKRDYSRVFTYMCLLFLGVAVTVYVFTPELVRFFGSGKLDGAANVVPYILVAYFFNAVYYWSASIFHLKNKTGTLSAIILVMALLSISLNWIATPIWGWVASASITVVSVGGAGILTFMVGQRIFPIRLETNRLLKIFASVAFIVLITQAFTSRIDVVIILVKVVLLLSLPVLLAITKFFSLGELSHASMLLQTLRKTKHITEVK